MRKALACLCAICALSLFSRIVAADAVVIDGGSTVAGKTIGEWTADWWNWAGASNVIGDPDGSAANNNQSGPVFFVAGTSGGAPVTRTFTVPAGKNVLFPLANWIIA